VYLFERQDGFVPTLMTPAGAQAIAMVATEYDGGSMTSGWRSFLCG